MALSYIWIGTFDLSGDPLAYGASQDYELTVPEDIPAGSLIFISRAYGSASFYTTTLLGDTVGNSYSAVVTGAAVALDCLALPAGEKVRLRLTNGGFGSIVTAVNFKHFVFAVLGDTVRVSTPDVLPGSALVTTDDTGSGSDLSATPRWRQMNAGLTAQKNVLVMGVETFETSADLVCGDVSRSMSGPDVVFEEPYSCSTVAHSTFYLLRILAVGFLLLNAGDTADYDVRYEWQPDTFLIPDASRLLYYFYEEVGNNAVAFDRSPADRRLVLAVGTVTQAEAYRYTDALPEVAGSAIVVDSGATQAVCLHYGRDTRLVCLFAQDAVVGYRISYDQGRTWGSVITVASGYEDVAQDLDDRGGVWVIALYKQSESRWYFTVGTLNEAGDTWSFSTPATLVSNSRRAGDLQRRSDGAWEFAYVNTSGAVAIVRCTNLTAAGGGTWS